jgi:hypothetical protein
VTVLDTSVESQLGLFATPETIAADRAISRGRGVLDGRERKSKPSSSARKARRSQRRS